MIAYDLQCSGGHRFEGWFEDAAAYDEQSSKGLIACPVCNGTGITRIPSTFAIKQSSTAGAEKARGASEQQVLVSAIMHFVEKNFDNVGTDFAKEALKIHYGVSEPRNIRGVSTDQEEETLKREGVQFFKFPIPDPSASNPSSDS